MESLARSYRYQVDVRGTAAQAIFANNPHVTPIEDGDPDVRRLDMHYPLINESDKRPCHFLQGYTEFLGKALGIDLACAVNRPALYLSDEEKGWTNQVEQETGYRGKFWLICQPGAKNDYTVKKWRHDWLQEVVNRLAKRHVVCVQVGEGQHNHKPLRGVINFISKTDTRQLIRLAYHAQGAITGESLLHHVMAAHGKPCVTLASGFLPASWIAYPTARVLTSQGALPCCRDRGCWKARVVPLKDGDPKDQSLCSLPVLGDDPVARCMAMIEPRDVVNAVLSFYFGGVLSF